MREVDTNDAYKLTAKVRARRQLWEILILSETTCPAADTPLSVLAALWNLIWTFHTNHFNRNVQAANYHHVAQSSTLSLSLCCCCILGYDLSIIYNWPQKGQHAFCMFFKQKVDKMLLIKIIFMCILCHPFCHNGSRNQKLQLQQQQQQQDVRDEL